MGWCIWVVFLRCWGVAESSDVASRAAHQPCYASAVLSSEVSGLLSWTKRWSWLALSVALACACDDGGDGAATSSAGDEPDASLEEGAEDDPMASADEPASSDDEGTCEGCADEGSTDDAAEPGTDAAGVADDSTDGASSTDDPSSTTSDGSGGDESTDPSSPVADAPDASLPATGIADGGVSFLPDGAVCDPNVDEACPCPPEQLRCAGWCIDPLTDWQHCGATGGCAEAGTVGVDCQPLSAVCERGECVPCEFPMVACGGQCIDPRVDDLYCGATPGCSPGESSRGDRCRTPERCISGACSDCVVFNAASTNLPQYARQLALGDVTSDGWPDVVSVTDDGDLIVLLGTGLQEIGEQLTQPFGQEPVALALGLLDGDEQLDVVVGDRGAGLVRIGLGNGDGSFDEGPTYAVDGTLRQIVLGDANADGALDAFVVSTDAGGLILLLGNGDGSFAQAPLVPSEDTLYSVSLGDLNGDEHLDAVATRLGDFAMIMLGDGEGGFEVSSHEVENTSWAGVLADLDGDGTLDLTTGHSAGYNINISMGNGDGTFRPPYRKNVSESTDSTDHRVHALDVADFDGDGRLDVVVAMGAGISIMWGHENWGADQHGPVTESSEFRYMITGDADGDGTTDIIGALFNTSQDFRIYYGEIPEPCRR